MLHEFMDEQASDSSAVLLFHVRTAASEASTGGTSEAVVTRPVQKYAEAYHPCRLTHLQG